MPAIMDTFIGLGILDKTVMEFSDVCRYHFGPWGERVALLFSLITLVGACK